MADDRDILVENALNVLGNPTSIDLAGQRGFAAEASPTGLPSAPSPEGAMPGPAGGLTPGPVGGEGAAGVAAATGGPGATGPSALGKALTGLNLFQQTLGAANKLQQMPGREANAFSVAQGGLGDLGFTLGGAPGAGWVETPIGAMSQQDYAGLLNAFRSGTEGPAGLAQGGFNLTQPGTDWSSFFSGMAGPGEYAGLGDFAEAAGGIGAAGEAAGAAGGAGGGLASAGLAAIPVIMAALKAAGVDMPQGLAEGISTGTTAGGALLAGSGLLGPATSASLAYSGPIGIAAALPLTAAMDLIRQGMEPSQEWQSFAPRLAQSLNVENAAANYFGNQLAGGGITSRQQLADAIGRYRATLGIGPESYESGTYSANLGPEYQQYLAGLTDPFALPALPGATGTAHEGRQNVDFGPMQNALDQITQAYLSQLPAGDVVSQQYAPWTLQEIGLSRHPMFYNPFWDQQAGAPESAGGE